MPPRVKANVLFFDRKPAAETPWTKELWVYDLRTNKHFTLKQNPLRREHLGFRVAVQGARFGCRRQHAPGFAAVAPERLGADLVAPRARKGERYRQVRLIRQGDHKEIDIVASDGPLQFRGRFRNAPAGSEFAGVRQRPGIVQHHLLAVDVGAEVARIVGAAGLAAPGCPAIRIGRPAATVAAATRSPRA